MLDLYFCPGCFHLNKNTPLKQKYKTLICNQCFQSKDVNDPNNSLYSAFAIHSKSGYVCHFCKRFIPKKSIKNNIAKCPYPDCVFIGPTSSLKHAFHPLKNKSYGIDHSDPPIFNEKLRKISHAIEDVLFINSVSGHQYTQKHKILILECFKELLHSDPAFYPYITNQSHSGGFQAKLFQLYINKLENSLPYSYFQNRKQIVIDSISHPLLNIFNGISSFNSTVNPKFKIKNQTSEIYIGSRNGYHTKPFYIGKLLSIINLETNKSLLEDVDYYTFSYIKLKNTHPHTHVRVDHLMVPPHYQSGAMSHINRVKKQVSDYFSKM